MLALPNPLVITVDPELAGWVEDRRANLGLRDRTAIRAMPLEEARRFEELERLALLPGIENGRAHGDTALYNLLGWTRFDLLATAVRDDLFGTEHLAWVDLGIGHIARPPLTFPAPTDAVTVLQMRPLFAEELENRSEVHRFERGRIAAGVIRGNRRTLEQLTDLFEAELSSVLDEGRRPTDQTILSALSASHPHLFDYTFGDYATILRSWDLVRGDAPTVLANIAHCRRFERWSDAGSRCALLRRSVEEGAVRLRPEELRQLEVEEALAAANDIGEEDPCKVPQRISHPDADVEAPGRQTVALCMIVRNEAKVIERCLASVRSIIDRWVIVDTGSTDGTPEIVTAALHDIPGELHHRPWIDFGTNRSQLMELARGTADLLLLLDADQTIAATGPLPWLDADAYLVGHSGPLAYAVPRVLRGDRSWRFEGATHEHLASDEDFTMEDLDVLTVEHHADGGSRTDKFTRDRDLLAARLAQHPDDVRATFYLAQTMRDLGEPAAAAELYRRRVELGGWDEEVFYAAFQLGVLVADVHWRAGLSFLVDAWERRPTRSEPLYEIATRARAAGDAEVALWAASTGVNLPMPADVLFVHRFVYEWGMRFELSIACALAGDIGQALDLTDELLALEAVPDDVRVALRSNRAWCLANVQDTLARPTRPLGLPPTLHELAPSFDLARFSEPDLDGRACNPSVASGPDECAAIVRSVNYDLIGGRYRMLGGDDVVRTVNHLVRLDSDLSPGQYLRLDDPPAFERHPTSVRGFEDCRLFSWHGSWWASATVRDADPDEVCRMVLLRVGEAGFESMRSLPSPEPGRHEKNWMPFIASDALHFVYSCRPFVVLRWDEQDATLTEARRVRTDHRFAGWRGGSPGLAIDGGHLFVVHQAWPDADGRRYTHRFLTVNGDLDPTGISEPFAFVHDGIEFCAGLARHGDDVLVSFGIDDRAAVVGSLALDEVIDMIEPLG